MTPCSLIDSNNVLLREVTRSSAIHITSTVKLEDTKLSFLQPPRAKGYQSNNISENFQFAFKSIPWFHRQALPQEKDESMPH